MAQIAVLERKCTGCGLCSESCPFGAIDMKDGKPELNAACRVCGICVKTCPEKAMIRLETRVASVDKSQWKDILVFAEVADGRLHPVSLELIGKARELAQGAPGFQVKAVLLGNGVMELARELQHYGVSEVVAYDDPALSFFRADVFATCIEDYIRVARPSVVLVGATSLGRSLAPRLSTRFHTGLTADCTRLELRENTDLVQIRPAFGGNIMAQILNTNHRPQFATVRYKVMDPAVKQDRIGKVVSCPIDPAKLDSRIEWLKIENKEEADRILAALRQASFIVDKVKRGTRQISPAPPFITSTMQQEASRRLGFTATRTMRAAQTLYEGVDIAGQGTMGLITYMRTDSLRIADEAQAAAKEFITETYGPEYVCPQKRTYKSKSATAAQDAHEAVRPTNPALTPAEVEKSVSGDPAKLYRLIWSRFIASQMSDCQQDTVSADITAAGYLFRASGYVVTLYLIHI